MSLEELLSVKIKAPGALTNLDLAKTPASVTSITAEEIATTPARNLMDLIEIYIPGAIWINSEAGPLIGFRGFLANQNNKFLMVLNGKVISTKETFASKTELEHWDLGDIERIDIIRGPGSVTYGPGAVAGVININTFSASSNINSGVAMNGVQRYNSLGVNGYIRNTIRWLDYFVYGSITRTLGYEPKQYLGEKDLSYGHIGEDIYPNGSPLDYFGDYQGIPQAKFHLNLTFLQNWEYTLRYTQQGSNWSGNEMKADFKGEKINQQSLRDRQLLSLLGFKKELSHNLQLHAKLSALFFDGERRKGNLKFPPPDSPANFKFNFSESEYLFHSTLNYKPNRALEWALGFEYSLDSLGPGWGDGQESMRLGGDGIIISGTDSKIYNTDLDPEDAVFAGNGWFTQTFSVFTEANFSFSPKYNLLLSGRVDKNSYSDWLVSPRAAIIGEPVKNHVLKVMVQQSVRRNDAGQLYIEHKNKTSPSNESIFGTELVYQTLINLNTSVSNSIFFNHGDIIAYDFEIDRNLPLGNLKLMGFESELKWQTKKSRLGLNYSLIQLLDWKLAGESPAGGISYSSYFTEVGDSLFMTGYGNSLNNWPAQSAKMFWFYNISPIVQFNLNAQLFWDYEGARDGLMSLTRAVKGDSLEVPIRQAIADAYDHGAYGLNSRINLGLNVYPVPKLLVKLYVLNLLGYVSNQRYSQDSGISHASTHRIRFVSEDRAIGLQLKFKI